MTAKERKQNTDFLLSLFQKEAKHHLWAKTAEGKAIVDPLIAKAREEWIEANPTRNPKDVNKWVNVYNKIRSEQFRLLPREEQDRWEAASKSFEATSTGDK